MYLQKHLWMLKSISVISLLALGLGWFIMVSAHPKTFIGLCHFETWEFSVNREKAIVFLLFNAVSILLSLLFFRMTRLPFFLAVMPAQFISIAVFLLFLLEGYAVMQ